MLGHASVAITLDIYSHVSPDLQRQAVSALDALFARPLFLPKPQSFRPRFQMEAGTLVPETDSLRPTATLTATRMDLRKFRRRGVLTSMEPGC